MISIKSNTKVNFKLTRTMTAGVLIMWLTMNTSHSELVIQEKDPSASIMNQFEMLKNSDAKSPQLRQFVTELNQSVTRNPSDSLAWEILAQTYYNNDYHAYALYAASEAIDLGHSTAKLKKILLNSSAVVSQDQLQSDYLTDEVNEVFLTDYQYALSKIYGDIYGFNYDESLPKSSAPFVKPKKAKVKNKSRSRKRTVAKRQAKPVKQKAARKRPSRQVPKTKPVNKLANPSFPKNSNAKSTDPFSILR